MLHGVRKRENVDELMHGGSGERMDSRRYWGVGAFIGIQGFGLMLTIAEIVTGVLAVSQL